MCRCRSVGAGVFRRYQAGGWEVSRNRCSPRGALVLAHEQFFEGGGATLRSTIPRPANCSIVRSRSLRSTVKDARLPPMVTSRNCGIDFSPEGLAKVRTVTDVRMKCRSSANEPESTVRPARTMVTR